MKIKNFISDWNNIRGKTYEFLAIIPENKINWKPHKDLGTFGMQIRHIGVSERAYIDGIKSGKIDFENKSYDKEIQESKEKGIAFLKRMDKSLINALKGADESKKIEFHDGIYGLMNVNLGTILEWLIQHETYHQGVFTCYGRLAGFGKFRFM